MKKIILYSLILFIILCLASCDEAINDNSSTIYDNNSEASVNNSLEITTSSTQAEASENDFNYNIEDICFEMSYSGVYNAYKDIVISLDPETGVADLDIRTTSLYKTALNVDKLEKTMNSAEQTQNIPIFKIDSFENMTNFYQTHKDYFYFEKTLNGIPSFAEIMKNKNEDFFIQNDLFLVYFMAVNSDSVYDVCECEIIDNGLLVHVSQSEQGYNEMTAGYMIFVTVPKAISQKCVSFNAYRSSVFMTGDSSKSLKK